jgi:hypothetical protein
MYGGETPLFPAIAIPVETKKAFECPQEHLDELYKCLGRVTRIVTIGWRATEPHFLSCLDTHLQSNVRDLMIVSGSQEYAEATKTQIIAGVPKLARRVWNLAPRGFSEFVTTGLLQRFLNDEM